MQIVGNAVKFTRGGCVVLTAEQIAPTLIATPTGLDLLSLSGTRSQPTTPAPSCSVLFSVTDTGVSCVTFGCDCDSVVSGIGMDQKTIDALFQPFTQADLSVTRRFGGTGLGLAISTKLVAAMGGSITVQSQPDRGSTFRIEIPFAVPLLSKTETEIKLQQAKPRTTISLSHKLSGRRLLLAEDNLVNQKVITRMLERLGAQCIDVVGNGQAAVDAFVKDPNCYSLVFMGRTVRSA